MNKKIIILSVIALSGLFLNSCNDELDVTPTASVSTQDLSLYNNDEGAKSFVTAVYAKF